MRMLKVAPSRNWLPESSRSFGSSSTTAELFFSFFPVGDLFRQSLTLTCWPTLPRPCQPATATRPVSLEMETEMLRAVITAPPSSCHSAAGRGVVWPPPPTHFPPVPPRPEESWVSYLLLCVFFFCVCVEKKKTPQNQSSGVVSNGGGALDRVLRVHQRDHQVQLVAGWMKKKKSSWVSVFPCT